MLSKFKYWCSCLSEVPNWLAKLSATGKQWLLITNRKQKYIQNPNGEGISILEEYTSMLRLAQLLPFFSNWLFQKSIQDFPFEFVEHKTKCENPKVSFIIGHRGVEKLPHLLLVIQSIAAQNYASLECIVIEQSDAPTLSGRLPDWVNYFFLHTNEDLYNRARAFNFGVSKAKGQVVFLHDNDLVIPSCYVEQHMKVQKKGYDLVNLKRLIFGLNKDNTDNVFRSKLVKRKYNADYILQNAKGGGSVCISKAAYLKIGGYDERFVGWGGEDNEFWQRAQTLKIFPFSNLPLLHLWHEPQPDKRKAKSGGGRYTESLYQELSKQSIYKRIQQLRGN